MRSLKIGLFLAIILFFSVDLMGQTPDPLPDDGTGDYLDQPENVSIKGTLVFVIVALGVGGIILHRKQRKETVGYSKK